MKKNGLFSLFLCFSLFGVCNGAYAADPEVANPVFAGLASRALSIGLGLRDAGFLIAGFGLIVFSFMAIFNKISWKMLAYIMFSTFVLSVMVATVNWVAGPGEGTMVLSAKSTGAGGESMDQTRMQVSKSDGSTSMGAGTGGELPQVNFTQGAEFTAPEQIGNPLEPTEPQATEQTTAQQPATEPTSTEADASQRYADISARAQELGGTRPQPYPRIEAAISDAMHRGDRTSIEKAVQGAQAALEYLNSLPADQQNEDIQRLKDYQNKTIEYANKYLQRMDADEQAAQTQAQPTQNQSTRSASPAPAADTQQNSELHQEVHNRVAELGGAGLRDTNIQAEIGQAQLKGNREEIEQRAAGAQATLDYINSLPPEQQNDSYVKKIKENQEKTLRAANFSLTKMDEKAK